MKLTAKQYAHVVTHVLLHATEEMLPRFSEAIWKLLKENRQEKLLPRVLRYSEQMYLDRKNMVRAEITLPFEANTATQQEMCTLLEQTLGKQVLAEFTSRPDIKGGVILQIGDTRIDGSVDGRLKRLMATFRS